MSSLVISPKEDDLYVLPDEVACPRINFGLSKAISVLPFCKRGTPQPKAQEMPEWTTFADWWECFDVTDPPVVNPALVLKPGPNLPPDSAEAEEYLFLPDGGDVYTGVQWDLLYPTPASAITATASHSTKESVYLEWADRWSAFCRLREIDSTLYDSLYERALYGLLCAYDTGVLEGPLADIDLST